MRTWLKTSLVVVLWYVYGDAVWILAFVVGLGELLHALKGIATDVAAIRLDVMAESTMRRGFSQEPAGAMTPNQLRAVHDLPPMNGGAA